MNKRLINTKQDSFLQNLEVIDNISYALVPRDYYAVGEALKETEEYRHEVEKQLKHSDSYLAIRKVFREKILGKRVKSIDELFDLQLDAMRRINYGLEIINSEARQRLGLLEKYVERINHDYESNFLGIDSKKDSLNPLLQDYISVYQKFVTLTEKDETYFSIEKSLRHLKRELSEGGLDYKKMLDVVEDLEKERAFLNVLEDSFRYSIQISERMVNKARRYENHVANTKDAYLMAKNINCGFAAVLKAVQNSTNMISQLQHVLADGLVEMGSIVSNPNIPPYNEFEMLLKSRHDVVKQLVNQRDKEKEKVMGLEKKLLR